MTHRSMPLNILHTSDWHLGRRLYGRARYDEFAEFLAWLSQTIRERDIDILIVAGDIFDTMTPSNLAQTLYYEFLGQVATSQCQHVVIVAGNHDSPTFLDAPKHILKYLNVSIIGTACEEVADEVLVLTDAADAPLAVVAAVPYLRDRDIRQSMAGESSKDKDTQVIQGISKHYEDVATVAKAQQTKLMAQFDRYVPIIATGHLFAAGGRTTADDGVRDLYVGSLGQVSAAVFDPCFDYVALGHLHVPQVVGGHAHIRYSGSPIAMGFGEAKQQKQVCLVRIDVSAQPTGSVKDKNQQQNLPSATTEAPLEVKSETSLKLKPQVKSKPQSKAQSKLSSQLQFDDLFADLLADDAHEDHENDDSSIGTDTEASVINNTDAVTPMTDTPMTEPAEAPDESAKRLNDSAKALDNPVEITNQTDTMSITLLPVPCFQKLVSIKGDMAHIKAQIDALVKAQTDSKQQTYNKTIDAPTDDSKETLALSPVLSPELKAEQDTGLGSGLGVNVWLEIIYEGDEIISNLREQILALAADTPFEILKIKNLTISARVAQKSDHVESLQDLSVTDVFERCLNTYDVPDEQQDELKAAYQHLLYDIQNEDKNAE